ncbi:MAG TPA: hypothetical protein VHP11_00260, partial [Tepidisphaeraceae bacterium]|nr:hypothetical protein [Tepidisphaeraceae bacterium]
MTLISAGSGFREQASGSLAKIPRLAKGQQDLKALLASPIFSLADLRKVVTLAPPDLGLTEAWGNTIMAYYGLPKYIPTHLHVDGDEKMAVKGFAHQSGNRITKHKGCVGELVKQGLEWSKRLSDNSDALIRTR